MTYEKPQKGNPHALTINQHTFPARSIERFAGSDGCVYVSLIKQNKTVRLKPYDQIFCAKRVWDQRAESGYMKGIEDKYQYLAESILNGSTKKIDIFLKPIVNEMYALGRFSVEPDALRLRTRAAGIAEVRSIVCYLAVRQIGLNGVEVGRHLGLGRSGVSVAADRGEKLFEKRSFTSDTNRQMNNVLVHPVHSACCLPNFKLEG